jgi:hypothetical protein
MGSLFLCATWPLAVYHIWALQSARVAIPFCATAFPSDRMPRLKRVQDFEQGMLLDLVEENSTCDCMLVREFAWFKPFQLD